MNKAAVVMSLLEMKENEVKELLIKMLMNTILSSLTLIDLQTDKLLDKLTCK